MGRARGKRHVRFYLKDQSYTFISKTSGNPEKYRENPRGALGAFPKASVRGVLIRAPTGSQLPAFTLRWGAESTPFTLGHIARQEWN